MPNISWTGEHSCGNLLAGIDPPPNDSTFAVCLSQPELGEILRKKALETANVEILFQEEFQRLEQRGGTVTYWTKNHSTGKETERVCQYLIGADGGRSSVRKSLDICLEGYTFESLQFIAINFQYDLRAAGGWKAANFIVDPVDWGIVVKRGKGTSWRFATGITRSTPETTAPLDGATIQLVKDRLSRILPGDTSKIQYEEMAPYTVHQRCASQFQKGNVFLAGASPDVLTNYANTRRRIFLERTNPASTANLMGLMSQEQEHIQEREDVFARLRDPQDFITRSQFGLPDFCLTSTSDKYFDTYGEVTWFISVTQIPEWTRERFKHEYKHVHAKMTRMVAEKAPVIQDPDYRKHAGKHIFCRLDQEGCIMAQVEKILKRPSADPVQCLVYHKRESSYDDFSPAWFAERSAKLKRLAANERTIYTYILWRDVTPRTANFFHGTQFSGGSWLQYKALETFGFEDTASARSFFERYSSDIVGDSADTTQLVIGLSDWVI
ncbi:FAD binding domain-containing protein [Aspergillus spinulosporus]